MLERSILIWTVTGSNTLRVTPSAVCVFSCNIQDVVIKIALLFFCYFSGYFISYEELWSTVNIVGKRESILQDITMDEERPTDQCTVIE